MADVLLADLTENGAGDIAGRADLEKALRSAIRTGQLAAGSALPSTRSLAVDLGVSRSTVVGAYEQLTAEGYLTAQQGSRTRVALHTEAVSEDAEVDLLGPTPDHDFRPGQPDVSAFPRARWLRSVRQVVRDGPDDIFGYADPRGVPELRSRLADYLARTRNVVASASSIRIAGGFGASLNLLGEALRRQGVTRIALEDPTLPFHAGLLNLAGLEVVTVPVRHDGIDTEQLHAAGVGAVVVTPAHQYPTGVVMSAERRNELVGWAGAAGGWIIEDDYDGEFRYDRRPIGSLQGLAPDRVIYAGTASKSLTPALRISWCVVPEALRSDLLRVTHVRAGVSALEQLTLADFIKRGELDRHVRLMRGRYRSRSTELRQTLLETAPWLEVGDSQAGLHLAARLVDTDLDEATVVAAGTAASVGLTSLATDHRSKTVEPGLAIGFSRPAEHHFPTALGALGNVLVDL